MKMKKENIFKRIKKNPVSLAYPVLGLLPCQDYLEKKIKHYARKAAVGSSMGLEYLACIGVGGFVSQGIGLALLTDAYIRFALPSFDSGIKPDGVLTETNPKYFIGSLFLEIPHRIGKKIVDAVKFNIQYYSKNTVNTKT